MYPSVRIIVIGFMFGNLFSILYSLAGRCTQPRSYDFHEEKIRLQHPWNKRCRWCFTQHRTAYHCRPDHDDFRADLLCAGAVDLRGDHRTSHWHTYRRSIKTYRNCSVSSQLRVKMHSKSPSVMAFCLVCLGILAKNMPKHLAGYYLPNGHNISNLEQIKNL